MEAHPQIPFHTSSTVLQDTGADAHSTILRSVFAFMENLPRALNYTSHPVMIQMHFSANIHNKLIIIQLVA